MSGKRKKAITLTLMILFGGSIVHAESTTELVSPKQTKTQAEKLLGGIGQAANAAYAKYLSSGNASDAVEIGKRLLMAQAYQAVLGPVTGALGGGTDNATNWLTIPDYQANGTDASGTEVNASTVDIGGAGGANGSETGTGAAAAYGNGTGIATNASGSYDYGGSGTAAIGSAGSLSDSTYTPGSGASTGLAGADGAFSGAIGGVVGGMQNQISNNAGYSVSVNGPQYVTAKVEMDPPNPLKNKPLSITASFVTLALPPGAMVVPDRTSQTETLSYDAAGTYSKTYSFGYDYYPPPDSHGNRPPTQHGTVTVTVKFNVNEFSSFGGGSGGQYGDINSSGGGTTVVGGLSSGGTSLNVSGSNMNGSGGYQLPQDGVLSSAATGLTSAASGLSNAAGGISDAIRSVLTGDMPLPWGRMTSGSEPAQNAISLAIPGFSGVGEGLYSVANSIQAVLGNRKTDHPAGIDAAEVAKAENGGKIQSDKTADQVRGEAMSDGSMNSILQTASKILAAKGIKATTAADFAQLYEDSPYTSPTDAWDMNRLDRIVTTKTAARIAQK